MSAKTQDEREQMIVAARDMLVSCAKTARFRADAQDTTVWGAYTWAAQIMEVAAGYLGEETKEP